MCTYPKTTNVISLYYKKSIQLKKVGDGKCEKHRKSISFIKSLVKRIREGEGTCNPPPLPLPLLLPLPLPFPPLPPPPPPQRKQVWLQHLWPKLQNAFYLSFSLPF
jgi:hypothetical protein